ncbi:uncharacterized protein LOC133199050 [Saccostrea echinata]|uniref:uncharacterized protein LOC133199050 n=1 Tax=Saccostrea echinata TaxID=191078 RepID=UPI002A7F66C9|nr:uncharacterized protein LOC133199050 [Saccostrea echinata]
MRMMQLPGWCVGCLSTCETHVYFRVGVVSPFKDQKWRIYNAACSLVINGEFRHPYTRISTNHLCDLCCVHQTDDGQLYFLLQQVPLQIHKVPMLSFHDPYSSMTGKGIKLTGLSALSLVAAYDGTNSSGLSPLHQR